MIRRSVLIGGLAACLASIAIACGPEFPWQLLDDRPGTLRATPANGFDFEAARLVAPPAGILRVEEAQVRSAEPAFADQLARAEAEGASSAVVATVKAMRRQPSGDAAYENGAGAPEAVRLYTAGAVDYRADDSAAARERFEAVLALPAAEARERAVWAAYMVGRIALLGDDAAATAGAFARTRAIAAAGAPDPLGLALASYGEEARMHLREARAIATDEAEVPADASAAYGAAMSRAVALYALQAAAGSQRGLLSLRIVAEELLKDRTRIDAVIADPVTRNLLVAYVLALVGDEPPTDAVGYDGGPRLDAGSDKRVTPNAALIRLVEAIERAGLKDVRGADRIAALAYRTGRLDLAGRAANLEDTALSHWVRAKFAVRRGDLDAAAAAYAAAAKAFPASPRVLDEAAGQLLSGERGVLSLARGEYREALRFLVAGPHPFWGDAAYVAERVLTVDELKQMLAPDIVRGGPVATTPETLASLRDLLARRLMREGRYREALPFFKDDATREQAKAFADALDRAETRWSRASRARATFAAAVLARRHGLEIMGTEGPPDYAAWAGNSETGLGRDSVEGEFVRPDETARVAASGLRPSLRWHYRYLAADLANRAADLVPPRSQAFAAALCWGDRWMQQTPNSGERGPELYRRYVREGAAVPFATTFGQECPEPDFAHLARASRPEMFRTIRRRLGWE